MMLYSGLVGLTLFVELAILAVPALSRATMYQCQSPSGSRVFTDSPAELRNCTALTTGTLLPPGPPAPVVLVIPTDRLSPQVVPGRDPALVPLATEPRGIPGTPAAPSLLGGVAAPSRYATVPLQRAGNLLVVQAQLNGRRETRLILDTGASHTILSRAVAQDLGLLSDPRVSRTILKTASGQVQADMAYVSGIRVGEVEVRNVLVAIYDVPDSPPGVEGLLGLTFLRLFQVLLDLPNNELHLLRGQ